RRVGERDEQRAPDIAALAVAVGLEQTDDDRRLYGDGCNARGDEEREDEGEDDEAEQDPRIGCPDAPEHGQAQTARQSGLARHQPEQEDAEIEPRRLVDKSRERGVDGGDMGRPEQKAADQSGHGVREYLEHPPQDDEERDSERMAGV